MAAAFKTSVSLTQPKDLLHIRKFVRRMKGRRSKIVKSRIFEKAANLGAWKGRRPCPRKRLRTKKVWRRRFDAFQRETSKSSGPSSLEKAKVGTAFLCFPKRRLQSIELSSLKQRSKPTFNRQLDLGKRKRLLNKVPDLLLVEKFVF